MSTLVAPSSTTLPPPRTGKIEAMMAEMQMAVTNQSMRMRRNQGLPGPRCSCLLTGTF